MVVKSKNGSLHRFFSPHFVNYYYKMNKMWIFFYNKKFNLMKLQFLQTFSKLYYTSPRIKGHRRQKTCPIFLSSVQWNFPKNCLKNTKISQKLSSVQFSSKIGRLSFYTGEGCIQITKGPYMWSFLWFYLNVPFYIRTVYLIFLVILLAEYKSLLIRIKIWIWKLAKYNFSNKWNCVPFRPGRPSVPYPYLSQPILSKFYVVRFWRVAKIMDRKNGRPKVFRAAVVFIWPILSQPVLCCVLKYLDKPIQKLERLSFSYVLVTKII